MRVICDKDASRYIRMLTIFLKQGSAHSKWASRNQHTRDVVEVIDTGRDNLDADKIQKEAGIVDEEASSDSDSSSDEDDDGEERPKGDIPDGSANDQQGLLDQARSYKKRDKALHRQHRGLMQWKVSDLPQPAISNAALLLSFMTFRFWCISR